MSWYWCRSFLNPASCAFYQRSPSFVLAFSCSCSTVQEPRTDIGHFVLVPVPVHSSPLQHWHYLRHTLTLIGVLVLLLVVFNWGCYCGDSCSLVLSPALVLVAHQLVVLAVVGVRHQHLHLVGQLVREGHIPAGVDLVQLPLADVRHSVLAHVVLVLRAQTSGPSEGERDGGLGMGWW